MVLSLTFASHEQKGSPGYFHLENPVPTPWSMVADALSHYRGHDLPQVGFEEWLSKLRKYSIDEAEKVPAVRMLEFFENFGIYPTLNVKNTEAIAPEVNYGVISTELLTKYIDYQVE